MRCAEALYIRAMCLYLDDNLDKSIQFVRQGLQYAPDNSCFLLLFKKLKQVKELREEGSKKFAASRFDEAKAEYNRCLEFVSTGEMNNVSWTKVTEHVTPSLLTTSFLEETKFSKYSYEGRCFFMFCSRSRFSQNFSSTWPS